MNRQSSDSGAAGIFTFVLCFFLAGILFFVIGFGVDKFTLISSNMFVSGDGYSQLRFDTVNTMLLAFRIEPFILLLGLGLNYWVTEMRQFSAMADVGTMIIGTVELITMTLILIAFTLFGGFGLDTVVNFVNHYPIAGYDVSLFSAVQYICPTFYGIMFLILVSIIVQFLMTCVSTVDYSQYQY